MSDLPRGWVREPLENLVQPRSDRVSPADRPDAPYLGLEHIQAQTNLILGTVPASSMASSSSSFEAGDVLYGRMRPYLNKVVRPMFAGLASAEFIIFPESEALDSGFLLKRLSAGDFVEFACSQYEGDRPRVKFDALGKFQVRLPPRAEQTRIVEKLEELLSGLDAGVAELKAAQKKLAQYRQSLLKAAVEGVLTAEWRAQRTPTETGAQLLEHILAERRARWESTQLAKFKEQSKAPPKDWQRKYSHPPSLDAKGLPKPPEGWVWARIDEAGDVQLGRQRSPQFHTGPNMVPYLRVANVFEERIDVSDVMEMHFSETEEATFKLAPGDVLLNEGQSLELVGRSAIFRGELARVCFTNTLVRFRAESGVLAEYALAVFLHYMHSGRFRKIAKITTNIAHLGAGRFAELEFPLPPGDEQAEVVRVLRAALDEVQRHGAAIALALKQSTAQRQSLLRAAFAGELVPQDPNDEPASVLLERIRVERVEREEQPKVRKPSQRKEIVDMVSKLIDVLAQAGDWVSAREAFQRCGVSDGAKTDQVEALYAELRALDKAGRLAVESVFDPQGRKLYDRLKLLAS